MDPTKSRAQWLDPELASSWEVGLDLRFFNDKTKFDLAYYQTKVDNQIVTVRVSPTQGNILQTRNEGAIQNKGVELQWNQEIMRNRDFQWYANLNFGFNSVVKLLIYRMILWKYKELNMAIYFRLLI